MIQLLDIHASSCHPPFDILMMNLICIRNELSRKLFMHAQNSSLYGSMNSRAEEKSLSSSKSIKNAQENLLLNYYVCSLHLSCCAIKPHSVFIVHRLAQLCFKQVLVNSSLTLPFVTCSR